MVYYSLPGGELLSYAVSNSHRFAFPLNRYMDTENVSICSNATHSFPYSSFFSICASILILALIYLYTEWNIYCLNRIL